MKITVSKYNSARTKLVLFEEPQWDHDDITLLTWRETKERYSCDIQASKFCLDLIDENGKIKDTFYMSEKDYSRLTNLKNKKVDNGNRTQPGT